jgi:putative heme iron utilization protein
LPVIWLSASFWDMSVMEESELATLQRQRDRLLAQKTILLTARGESDQPEMGVTPFIRHGDALFIYPSRLSAHVRAVLARGQGQFLLIEDEQAAQNIWARVRLKFDADIDEIARQDALFAPLCDAFAAAHGPTMGVIRDFTDFHMLRLRPRSGVLVTGFARAYRVEGADFTITEHLKNS